MIRRPVKLEEPRKLIITRYDEPGCPAYPEKKRRRRVLDKVLDRDGD